MHIKLDYILKFYNNHFVEYSSTIKSCTVKPLEIKLRFKTLEKYSFYRIFNPQNQIYS